MPPRLIGFEAAGWAYLACRATDSAPGYYWWEDQLANWMIRAEVRLSGASWGIDRWIVSEAHIRSIQLAVLLLASAAGTALAAACCRAARRHVEPGSGPDRAAPATASLQ